jgi:glycosyltransferase involved in cell wall biosynthesis
LSIKIITAHYLPKINAGSIRLKSFVKSWQKKCDIEILTENNKALEEEKYIERTFSKLASNNQSFLYRIVFEIIFSIEVFIRLLFSKDDDIYFVSSPPFLLAVSVFMVSKLKKTEYILDIRDLYPEILFNLNIIKRNGILAKILLYFEQTIYNNALMISTVTNGLLKHISKKTDNKNIYLIRNGYDKDLFYYKKLDKNKDQFTIMFHGTIGKLQNIELILDYAELLLRKDIQDINFLIIGDGGKSDYLKKEIKNRKLNNIDYLGRKHIKEIPEIINSVDLGISPRMDGVIGKTAFPVKVYEYLACGVPVIVTPISEVGSFLENNNIGYQLPNDIEELHDIIMYIKNNKEIYQELVDNAKEKSKEFERSKIADNFFDIIKSHIG